jgi:hypothetical protein
MADDVKRCAYCYKPLLSKEAIDMGYCSGKCLDKMRVESRDSKKVRAEVDRLMKQYERGGWKP